MNVVVNPVFNPIVVAVGGMQVILSAHLLAFAAPPALNFSSAQLMRAPDLSPLPQDQGDSPDMSGREGVPPSAGSGSR